LKGELEGITIGLLNCSSAFCSPSHGVSVEGNAQDDVGSAPALTTAQAGQGSSVDFSTSGAETGESSPEFLHLFNISTSQTDLELGAESDLECDTWVNAISYVHNAVYYG
jgi:hypothetical protein